MNTYRFDIIAALDALLTRMLDVQNREGGSPDGGWRIDQNSFFTLINELRCIRDAAFAIRGLDTLHQPGWLAAIRTMRDAVARTLRLYNDDPAKLLSALRDLDRANDALRRFDTTGIEP